MDMATTESEKGAPRTSVEKADETSTMRLDLDAQSEDDYKRFGLTQKDLDDALEHARGLDLVQAKVILEHYLEEHGDDMLIPQTITDAVIELSAQLNVDHEKMEPVVSATARIVAAVFDSNSAYREIRALFTTADDMEEPCGTIRAWVIGLLWSVGLAALNQFFAPRNPTITVSVYLAQLFAYPMGTLCARVLPTTVFLPGSRFRFTLNPGPFTLKEHMLITIMSNVTSVIPNFTYVYFIQRLEVYLGREWAGSFGYQICLLMFLLLFGFSLAGMLRRFLIYPPQMIWYFTLSQAAMNQALHNEGNSVVHRWTMSRSKFFYVTFGAMFLYYWLPGTIFPTLTFFNWMTWIRPQNAVLSILTGSYYFNLGLNPFVNSFDWNWFTATVNPIITPYFIVLQIVLGCFVWAVCVIIPVFFTNTWYTAYFPINSWYRYDNTGQIYDTSAVVGEGFKFNQTAYEAYSPVFIPAASALRYAMMFGVLTAAVTFTWLWYGNMLMSATKKIFSKHPAHTGSSDIHSRLMAKYAEVPELWFVGSGIIAGAFGFAALLGWDTQTPAWVIPFTIIISGLFVIPLGIVEAISSYQPTLEIIFEVIGGYVCQGNPGAWILFDAIGVGVTSQALSYASDMKLGHYVKIPPRQLFTAQVASTILSAFVTVAVVRFQLSIDGICNPEVNERWVCGTASTTFGSAIVWGLLGPARSFTHVSARYWKVMFALIAGAAWPFPWYYARKRWPHSLFRYAHPVAMMLGGILWAPFNLSMFWQALLFAWFFGVFVKDRYPDWWSKYAYVLAASLSAGIALSALIQFFAITNADVTIPNWWGSTQYEMTCDFQTCPYKTVASGETFGPKEWH